MYKPMDCEHYFEHCNEHTLLVCVVCGEVDGDTCGVDLSFAEIIEFEQIYRDVREYD